MNLRRLVLVSALALLGALTDASAAPAPPSSADGLRPLPSTSDIDPSAHPECLAAQAVGVQSQGLGPAAPGRDPAPGFAAPARPAPQTAGALVETSILEKFRAFRESLTTP